MSTGRRLAKRSILGTRVSVPGEDGRYYPGIIQSAKAPAAPVGGNSSSSGDEGGNQAAVSDLTASGIRKKNVYNVMYDDGSKTVREFDETIIVGPGFRSVSSVKLKPGQRVFVTYNGREMCGEVVCHWPHIDEIQIRATSTAAALGGQSVDTAVIELKKRLDEIRLLESRKSARLHELDQDYSRLADFGTGETRKRQTSHVIDVPSSSTQSSGRKRRPSSADEYDSDVLDDCSAAMVLMSLSCSPKSPRLPSSYSAVPCNFFGDIDGGIALSHSWTEPPGGGSPHSPLSSSGASSWNSARSQASSGPHPAGHRAPAPRTPSPSNVISGQSGAAPPGFGLSESAPASVPALRFGGRGANDEYGLSTNNQPSVGDEGIDLPDDSNSSEMEFVRRKRRNSSRTVYQCTWPGCGKMTGSCSAIEKHVRSIHLGRLNKSESLSDHEEEFYYTEREFGVALQPETFADMYTSSPPTLSHMDMVRPPHEDPEYQKQIQNSPPKFIRLSPKAGGPPPPFSLAKLNNGSGGSNGGSSNGGASSGPSASRKPRGDSKKCRKVYGMENRDHWCTQCKWKKACTRFMD